MILDHNPDLSVDYDAGAGERRLESQDLVVGHHDGSDLLCISNDA